MLISYIVLLICSENVYDAGWLLGIPAEAWLWYGFCVHMCNHYFLSYYFLSPAAFSKPKFKKHWCVEPWLHTLVHVCTLGLCVRK